MRSDDGYFGGVSRGGGMGALAWPQKVGAGRLPIPPGSYWHQPQHGVLRFRNSYADKNQSLSRPALLGLGLLALLNV